MQDFNRLPDRQYWTLAGGDPTRIGGSSYRDPAAPYALLAKPGCVLVCLPESPILSLARVQLARDTSARGTLRGESSWLPHGNRGLRLAVCRVQRRLE